MMASEAKNQHNNISDFVSIYFYSWDVNNQDIRILFCERDGILCVPSKKVFPPWACSDNSSLRSNTIASATSLEMKERLVNQTNEESNVHRLDKGKSDGSYWAGVIEELCSEVIRNEIPRGNPKLVHLLRVYSSYQEKHYSHASFAVQLQNKDFDLIDSVNGFQVLTRKCLTNYKLERVKMLWIIQDIYKCIQVLKNLDKGEEKLLIGANVEEIDPCLIYCKQKKQHSITPSLLFDSPGYSHLDKERLYEEFVQLSYPYSTVVYNNIKSLLTHLGFNGKEVEAFRALDQHNSGELDMYQFMLGLTAMDPSTQHGNGPAEFRCRQIFRFYDEDSDGFLNEAELENMIRDITAFQNQQNQNFSSEQLKDSVQNAIMIICGTPTEKVSLTKFLLSVGNLRFRGTSSLYRATNSIPTLLAQLRDRPEGNILLTDYQFSERNKRQKRATAEYGNLLPKDYDKIPLADNTVDFSKDDHHMRDSLQNEFSLQSSGYTLAEHTVMVRRSGMISNVNNLLDMERAGEVCNTGLETLYEHEETHQDTSCLSCLSPSVSNRFQKHRVEKQFSAQAFNIKSLPNEILSALRYFEYGNDCKKAMTWGAVDKLKLARYISSICDNLKDILEDEPRLLSISTPCYILGDLHGNFHDLICFEKALWRLGPHLTPANFLFLGDYVDRGDFGVEVVIYLFAQKIRAPNRFHLLRGNHEIREIQKSFTFYSECISKFGEQLGLVVWEEINKVFDRMPFAAVVDKKIFCIHGGVPRLDGHLQEINKIPCPLSQPENESELAWQMMWNDPIALDDINEETKLQLKTNKGFANNMKRQTAFVFNEEAFDRFLEKNKLTHVIRAHEVKQAGFEIQQNGRLFTVFSSSQYCGSNNEAACILVHDMRIRIIRVDTT